MNVGNWLEKRGVRFVFQRASLLTARYGITPGKAISRIDDSLMSLAEQGCAPTFPSPGIIVQRYPQFFQRIQDEGAEIAVHSYQHVDLNSITIKKAREQLTRAVNIFRNNGIIARGFRCPYLSCSDELLESLPAGLFGYSSNRAIWLDAPRLSQNDGQNVIFNILRRFYNPKSSTETICTPWTRSNMIEIPVCVPDDLQLHDGLNLDTEGISQAWIEMLHQTHRRGELFNLIFHPELGSVVKQSFEDLLHEALRLEPVVWITRLQDICDWWNEKSGFKVDIQPDGNDILLNFSCTPHATILVRGLGTFGSDRIWDGAYYRLPSKTVTLPAEPRPFVGLQGNSPVRVASFLREQGYIVEIGELASSCGIYIDAETLAKLCSDVQIVEYIESNKSPLVRFWRWPDGAKSALCVTGDLDALSLQDYVSRLFIA